MLDRFLGEKGQRVLVDSLLTQKLVAGDHALAETIAKKAELISVPKNQAIISQGDGDNKLFFILSGLFNIVINGRLMNKRSVNDHVGEMAAIDPSLPRSATVIASESSIVAALDEPSLAEIAKLFPELYRRVAKELARRLHQRNAHVGTARSRVKLFVISSVEALPIAREIQNAFGHDAFITTVWTDGVFKVAGYPLQSLLDAIDDSDFAVAIAHADDIASYRQQEWPIPRDNVVFELGLFMGRLGRDRAILMEPRSRDVKLPSDLAGVTTITYRYESGVDTASLLAPACNQLRDHIKSHGPNL